MTCIYKESLGKLREGVHFYRIFDIAIIDVLFTIILAYIINFYNPTYNIKIILLCLFITGIICHRMFCVKTTIDKLLFN